MRRRERRAWAIRRREKRAEFRRKALKMLPPDLICDYTCALFHRDTFLLFAWVNLCRKDSTRPGPEGAAQQVRERPRSRTGAVPQCGSLLGGTTMKGLHIIADLYNCAKSDYLVSSDKLRDLCVKACVDS